MRNLVLIVWCVALFISCNSKIDKNTNNSFFESGDTICFVGNSITHGGLYYQYLELYYLLRYPTKEVTFINCGVAGDEAMLAYKGRVDSDILVHKPDYATIMFGMNDIRRDLYEPKDTGMLVMMQRKCAIDTCAMFVDSLINVFLANNIRPIILTPTIYEQNIINNTENLKGCNEALGACAKIDMQYSEHYQIPLVDNYHLMDSINNEIQKENPNFTIVGNDRVHPDKDGNFIMFYAFLKALEKPNLISSIKIDAATELVENVNCDVSNTDISNKNITFKYSPKALPFPTHFLNYATNHIPFESDFNTELIKVSNLDNGNYKIKIDSVEICNVTNSDLVLGINLASYKHAPQYQHSMEIYTLLDSISRTTADRIRNIAFVEYFFAPEVQGVDDLDEREKIIKKVINSSRDKSYYQWVKGQGEAYLKNKNKVAEIESLITNWRKELDRLKKQKLNFIISISKQD